MSERLIFSTQPWREGLRKPVNWIIGALAIVSIFLIASQLFVASELNSVIRAQDNYRQYDAVLTDLVLNLTSAETGQRGYLITQQSSYLAPYNQALPTISHDLAVIKASPLSAPYKPQIQQLSALSSDKLKELSLSISTEQSQGQSAAYEVVNSGAGEYDMNQIRQITGGIHDAQSTVLDSQQDARARSVSDLLLITVLAVLCILALILQVLLLGRVTSHKEASLDAMRQQFMTIAAHQLRTPATAIKQYLFLLLSDTYGPPTSAHRKVLGQIEASNERGIKIVNSLLDVTRLEAAGVSIQAEPIDLTELTKELVEEYQQTLKVKRQTIDASIQSGHIKLMADAFYLRMAMENLLDNASKYSADGQPVHLLLKSGKSRATIVIRDEGIGIKEEDISKLFTKFARLRGATTASTQGSGLGLYIAKLIVQLHGGTIAVESAPQKGTAFTIKLPLRKV